MAFDMTESIKLAGTLMTTAEASLKGIKGTDDSISPEKLLQFQMDLNKVMQLISTISDTLSSTNSSISKLSQNLK